MGWNLGKAILEKVEMIKKWKSVIQIAKFIENK